MKCANAKGVGRAPVTRPLQSIRSHIMSIKQKSVITGASQGIGAGSVRAYRDWNYRVIASFRSVKASSDTDIIAVPGDIIKPETAERIAVLANVGAAATGVMSLRPVSRVANSTCINPG